MSKERWIEDEEEEKARGHGGKRRKGGVQSLDLMMTLMEDLSTSIRSHKEGQQQCTEVY